MSRRTHASAVPLSLALVADLAAGVGDARAQTASPPAAQPAPQAAAPKPGDDTVVVTATRRDQPSLLLPAGVDRLFGEEIRFGRPQVNLSESIGRVPGIVVQNRQNYAQDLQVHSRGFGSRSTFGIRGLRLYQDGKGL